MGCAEYLLVLQNAQKSAEREVKYQLMIDMLGGSILKGIDDIQDRLDIKSLTAKYQV